MGFLPGRNAAHERAAPLAAGTPEDQAREEEGGGWELLSSREGGEGTGGSFPRDLEVDEKHNSSPPLISRACLQG